MAGEAADRVEMADQRQDAVGNGDDTVLAGSGFFAAYHVLLLEMDIFDADAGQLVFPGACVDLDQDDLGNISCLRPQPPELT